MCGDGVISYLVDGSSPAIDTSTSDWASQLVTVRKHRYPFDHVVLTFDFNTSVSFSSIELELVLCPEWNIGAPLVSVYASQSTSLVNGYSFDLIMNHTTDQTSCDSLLPVSVPFQGEFSYEIWHILVTFTVQPNIEWVHVGEVRFLDTATESESTLS